jgi:hypothetical protein
VIRKTDQPEECRSGEKRGQDVPQIAGPPESLHECATKELLSVDEISLPESAIGFA